MTSSVFLNKRYIKDQDRVLYIYEHTNIHDVYLIFQLIQQSDLDTGIDLLSIDDCITFKGTNEKSYILIVVIVL